MPNKARISLLVPLLFLVACGEPTAPPVTVPEVVPAPSRVITQVALTADGGAPAPGAALSFDPTNGWMYDEPGNLYVGPAPESNLNEGAITCVAPSNNPGYDTGGRCSFYKRVLVGYGLLSPQVARFEVDNFESEPSDDGSGSGWTNGTMAIRANGAHARWSAPRTTTPSGAASGETNEVAACGGKLSWGVNNGLDGNTCFNAVNDVEIGYDHRLLAHTGLALDPAVTPAITGALSQVVDPAARAVLASIIAALSSQQLHVATNQTQ